MAIKFTDAALQFEPDNLTFLNQKRHIQMLMQNYDGMLQTVNKCLSIQRDNLGLADLGKVYMLKREFDKAEVAYMKFFALHNEMRNYTIREKTSYAYVLRKIGKEKEAINLVQQAKGLINAYFDQPDFDLAKVYAFTGEKAKAIDHLKKWTPNYGMQVWIENEPLFENIKDEPEFKILAMKYKREIEEMSKLAGAQRARGEFPTTEMIR